MEHWEKQQVSELEDAKSQFPSGGKVLDLGACDGSTSKLFGSGWEWVGIDISPLNSSVIKGDAHKLDFPDEKFDIIIMNSVLHQIYPNFEGEEVNKFMNKLGQMTKFCMVFETPVDHPKMNLTLDAIKGKLNKWWGPIKISYVYDAYSTGYRAIFICLKKK